MFKYCKKCGLIKNIKSNNSACPVCESELLNVPKEYLTPTGIMFISPSARQEFENIVKSSDEYDEELATQREKILSQKEDAHKKEIAQKVSEYNSKKPQKICPVCHSTSISKISNIGKVAKVTAFGILGAGDLGKTWRCNSCGYKF